jgi:hypothetical protein
MESGFGFVDERLRAGVERLIEAGHDPGDPMAGYYVSPERAREYKRWQESGGPPVQTPIRKGFGSILLERVFDGQAGVSFDIQFKHDGLIFDLAIPLAVQSPQAGPDPVGGQHDHGQERGAAQTVLARTHG